MPGVTTVDVMAQTLQIDGVSDITVTEILQDADVGDYVREIRIWGLPLTEGALAPLVMTLRLRHQVRVNLEISVPTSEF